MIDPSGIPGFLLNLSEERRNPSVVLISPLSNITNEPAYQKAVAQANNVRWVKERNLRRWHREGWKPITERDGIGLPTVFMNGSEEQMQIFREPKETSNWWAWQRGGEMGREILGLLALVATSIQVHAASANSEDLIRSCQLLVKKSAGMNQTEAWQSSYCLHYISGFYDGYTTGRLYTKGNIEGMENLIEEACFPEGLSWLQLAAVYVKWASDHPEMWHLERWQTVRAAFAESFPCDPASD